MSLQLTKLAPLHKQACTVTQLLALRHDQQDEQVCRTPGLGSLHLAHAHTAVQIEVTRQLCQVPHACLLGAAILDTQAESGRCIAVRSAPTCWNALVLPYSVPDIWQQQAFTTQQALPVHIGSSLKSLSTRGTHCRAGSATARITPDVAVWVPGEGASMLGTS